MVFNTVGCYYYLATSLLLYKQLPYHQCDGPPQQSSDSAAGPPPPPPPLKKSTCFNSGIYTAKKSTLGLVQRKVVLTDVYTVTVLFCKYHCLCWFSALTRSASHICHRFPTYNIYTLFIILSIMLFSKL